MATTHERKNRRRWQKALRGVDAPWEAISAAAAKPPSSIVDWLRGNGTIGIARLPCLKKNGEIVHWLNPTDNAEEAAKLLPLHVIELVVSDEVEQHTIAAAQAKLEAAAALTFGQDMLDSVVQDHPELVLTPYVLTRLLKLAQHYHLKAPLILQGMTRQFCRPPPLSHVVVQVTPELARPIWCGSLLS